MTVLLTIVVPLVALLVSATSALAAIWALRQTRIYQPQARWEPVWPHSRNEQSALKNASEVRLINHGSATAYRVKLTIDTVMADAASGPQRYEKNDWSVAPGDAIGLVTPLQRSTATWNADTKKWKLTANDPHPVRPMLTITWHEGSTSRQRSARFRYPD